MALTLGVITLFVGIQFLGLWAIGHARWMRYNNKVRDNHNHTGARMSNTVPVPQAWVVLFQGGGWNTVVAYDKADAIRVGNAMFGPRLEVRDARPGEKPNPDTPESDYTWAMFD